MFSVEKKLQNSGHPKEGDDIKNFAYLAAHDLQEPLTVIAYFAELLAMRYKPVLDKEGQEYVDYILDSVNLTRNLIQDLVAYSKIDSSETAFESVDLTECLGKALQNLKAAVEASQAVITHDSLPTVSGDGPQLSLLFQNLLSNAMKFRREPAPAIHVSASQREGQWWIQVKDNGLGIEEPYQELVFRPFKRLHSRGKYPGSGMGLAICQKIVERHGGKIGVESKPGEGSTFYFSLGGG